MVHRRNNNDEDHDDVTAANKLLELISQQTVESVIECTPSPTELKVEEDSSVFHVDTDYDTLANDVEQGSLIMSLGNHVTVSSDEALCPKTELMRQSNSSLSQPGAFRMRGPTTLVTDNSDDQSSTTTGTMMGTLHIPQDGGLIASALETPDHACETRTTEDDEHTLSQQNPPSSPPLLVNAQLVSNDSPYGDLEAGQRTAVELNKDILTASPFEDVHIFRHLLRQRRIQVALFLLALVFVSLVVGMVVGLSQDIEPTVLIVSNNGTTSVFGEQAEKYTDSMDFD